MDTIQPSSNSTFDQMIDKLRGKSEEELKLLYLKFFSDDLIQEWKEITSTSKFEDASF